MELVDRGCSKLIRYLGATRPALRMAVFIVSVDFALIEHRSEQSEGSWMREESVKGRGAVTREPSAPREGRVEQVGKGLRSRQAAVSPLLMMTGRGSQQAANADCRGW